MKKMLLVPFAAALALSTLTACGDSSSDPKPTKAQECANGLSSDCLVGSWNMIGLANSGTGEILPSYNYTAPGKLTFNEDGSFQFDLPAAAPADLRTIDCNPVYGTWSVSGNTLAMEATVNGMCLAKKRTTVVPVITTNGAQIKMTTGSLWLLENATDEKSIKENSTEVYTISAN